MKSGLKEFLEWIYCIVIAVVIALLIKYYIGIPTVVMQVSMYPTFKQGDRLILDRTTRTFNKELKRGDVVTFEAPSKTSYTASEVDLSNPVAKYDYKINGVFNKFVYYVLETTKTSYIKRVIGLPGERVTIQDGKVYINGKELNEPYLQNGVVTTQIQNSQFMDIVVPDNCYFLMGDNRPSSSDCRCFGCIPKEKIESRVVLRFWPLNEFGTDFKVKE